MSSYYLTQHRFNLLPSVYLSTGLLLFLSFYRPARSFFRQACFFPESLLTNSRLYRIQEHRTSGQYRLGSNSGVWARPRRLAHENWEGGFPLLGSIRAGLHQRGSPAKPGDLQVFISLFFIHTWSPVRDRLSGWLAKLLTNKGIDLFCS